MATMTEVWSLGGRESVAPSMLGVVCDRLDCPAAAFHRVDVFNQDFYFCHHHWLELDPVLRTEDVERLFTSGLEEVETLAASPAFAAASPW